MNKLPTKLFEVLRMMGNEPTKQIIVMRKDLNMRKGKMIAQGAHASVMAVLDNSEEPLVREWATLAMTKICVGVNSEEELDKIVETAQEKGLITAVVRDAGRTEFNGEPTVTCAAIGPARESDFVGVTDHLALL